MLKSPGLEGYCRLLHYKELTAYSHQMLCRWMLYSTTIFQQNLSIYKDISLLYIYMFIFIHLFIYRHIYIRIDRNVHWNKKKYVDLTRFKFINGVWHANNRPVKTYKGFTLVVFFQCILFQLYSFHFVFVIFLFFFSNNRWFPSGYLNKRFTFLLQNKFN